MISCPSNQYAVDAVQGAWAPVKPDIEMVAYCMGLRGLGFAANNPASFDCFPRLHPAIFLLRNGLICGLLFRPSPAQQAIESWRGYPFLEHDAEDSS